MSNRIINDRIARGERVYLIEVYKELGFETYFLPESHPAHHAFWDKNGFHEGDYDARLDEADLITFNSKESEKIMSNQIVFEVIEKIDSAIAYSDIYGSKENAWKNIGHMIDDFIEGHKNSIDIIWIEIDPEDSMVYFKYVYKKSHIVQCRFYKIKGRIVH